MMEDLLLRLADALSVEALMVGNDWQFVIFGFRRAYRGVMNELRARIMDMTTFEWRTPSARGSFVRLVDYRGDDLVVTLVNPKQIQRWQEGVAVYWQVRALMSRLGQDSSNPMGANHAH